MRAKRPAFHVMTALLVGLGLLALTSRRTMSGQPVPEEAAGSYFACPGAYDWSSCNTDMETCIFPIHGYVPGTHENAVYQSEAPCVDENGESPEGCDHQPFDGTSCTNPL